MSNKDTQLVNDGQLIEFASSIFKSAGVPDADAVIVARALVDADLEGNSTHGVSRLPVYIKRIKAGLVSCLPEIAIEKEGPAYVVIDGGNGLGQVVATRAMDEAIRLAEQSGVGIAAVKSSNHLGVASYYCKMATRKNMIGLAFTNAPAAITPWGSKEAYFGTNPIALAAPTGGGYPVVVDLSTSVIARGKIVLAAQKGEKIPSHWAYDKDGVSTENPVEALAGSILPMAGPKGYALAMAVEILTGILTGAAYGRQVGDMYGAWNEPANIGHFMIALNVSSFIPLDSFTSRLDAMVEEIKALKAADGFSEILIPGERRARSSKERALKGIPFSNKIVEELTVLGNENGVEVPKSMFPAN